MDDLTLEQALTQRQTGRRAVIAGDEPEVKLVIFELTGQLYAVHGARIREILVGSELFFVPGAPPSLEGVVNVRGDIEAVIRPNALLQLPESHYGPQAAILLSRGTELSVGLRVERVLNVLDLPKSAIQPPPATLPDSLANKMQGVFFWHGKSVTLLDLDALLSDYAQGIG